MLRFLLIIILFIVTMMPLSGITHLVVELCIQYRLQVAMLTIMVAIVTLWKKQYRRATLCGLIIVSHTVVISDNIPWAFSYYKDDKSDALRILTFNVKDTNTDYHEIDQILAQANADIIVLAEAKYGFFTRRSKRISQGYPYTVLGHRDAILSKYPLHKVNLPQILEGHITHVKARIDGASVNLISIHTYSPRSTERIYARNTQLFTTAEYINTLTPSTPLIVAGDFNSAPWSPAMKVFADHTMLETIQRLPFLNSSWPTFFPYLLRIPIDSMYYNHRFVLHSSATLHSTGSDHRALYAEFALK